MIGALSSRCIGLSSLICEASVGPVSRSTSWTIQIAIEPKDARNVTGDYRPAAEAISIGRFGQHLVLLDGYHRAASFWKFASADASITAYRPTF
jgi:hypothetical protein